VHILPQFRRCPNTPQPRRRLVMGESVLSQHCPNRPCFQGGPFARRAHSRDSVSLVTDLARSAAVIHNSRIRTVGRLDIDMPPREPSKAMMMALAKHSEPANERSIPRDPDRSATARVRRAGPNTMTTPRSLSSVIPPKTWTFQTCGSEGVRIPV
jgi:hypothetical protein